MSLHLCFCIFMYPACVLYGFLIFKKNTLFKSIVAFGANWEGKGKTTIRRDGDGRKGRWGAQAVYVGCGQWGKEAHAWPQLPLRKLSHQLPRTYSPSAPNTQRPAFTTLGNFLCCFTVVTSLQLACTTVLLGRGTATCHKQKAWRQGGKRV